jgi:hypothetical protein
MDFCGVRPANIAKTRARLGHSVAGRSRRAAPGALGAGDRTAHFHIFCGSRSKARAARFPSRETVLVAGEAQSKRCRPVAEARRVSFSDGQFGGSASVPDSDPIPLDRATIWGTDQPYRVTA